MKVDGICEVGIAVNSLKATAPLYQDVLGGTLSERVFGDDGIWQLCRFSNVDLRLFEPRAATVPRDRLSYIGLRVQNLVHARAQLLAQGLAITEETPSRGPDLASATLEPTPFNGVVFKLVEGTYRLDFRPKPESANPPINGLGHIGINVRDLASAAPRFADLLGRLHSPFFERPPYGLRFVFVTEQEVLRDGPVDLELLSPSDEDGLIARSFAKIGEGIAHLCWSTPNAGAMLDWLRQRGCRLIDEQPNPVHAVLAAFVHPHAFNGVLHELLEGHNQVFDPNTPRVLL